MTYNPRFAPIFSAPRQVDLLAFPDFQLLDIAGPMQVFASANRTLEESREAPAYRLRIVARQAQTAAWAGLTLLSEPLPDMDEPCDTLVIAGGEAVHQAAEDAELVAWIARKGAQARRVAAICTGAFLAGAAGLLDGRRAVTHWHSCTRLAQRFPGTLVEADPIFIEDGKIWTSAGVTAGIDLALALVERDLGRAIALAVARDLVVFLKRPGGQSQYSAALALQHGEGRFEALHGWLRENLAGDLSIATLAARCGMSERSFQRHYRQATGLPPAQAVERLRVEQARLLLADTNLPLKKIVRQCGFGSEETMRRSFARQFATTPQAYRERFAA
jgi:transcriptional regulator GlxA family with amidase domain